VNDSRSQLIKEIAIHTGFDLVGVISPDQPLHYPVFEKWLESGRHAEMSYLSSDRSRRLRSNPSLLLTGCRSIVVLGFRYPAANHSSAGLVGRIASYAWIKDYHVLLDQQLNELVRSIEHQLKIPIGYRIYCDTGPVLERDLAQQAGLGWIGKNTCLIHPRYGSFFFLAEIFLDTELEHDTPFSEDRCGNCTRCIEACPTGCIMPDRTIDASRCISYLTIELKGVIPHGLRSSIDNWIFGCDLCQQACPWNAHLAKLGKVSYNTPELEDKSPSLIGELKLSPEDFQQKYKQASLKRPKRAGYLRNVTIALANLAFKTPQYLAIAEEELKNVLFTEAEPLVRGHAAWGLGRLGTVFSRETLQSAMQHESDEYVRQEIDSALNG
jgi:epoxyqueuosine reductase